MEKLKLMYSVDTRRNPMSPSTQTDVRNLADEDGQSGSVDPLANIEAGSLAWCRVCMYANPLVALGNAMLTGYVMSRIRRSRRRG